MAQKDSDKNRWKYIGLMAIGAVGLYQVTSGQNILIFTILTIIIVVAFLNTTKVDAVNEK